MRRLFIVSFIGLALGVVAYSQSRGTPNQLRVNVDANGYLLTASAAQTNPVTQVQFNNARLAVDSSGNLLTVISGGSGVGTVTSVAATVPSALLAISGSPITTTGTLAFSLPTRAANLIFSGPATGIDATPTFRSLVSADLPSGTITGSIANTQVAFGTGTNIIGGDADLTWTSATNYLTTKSLSWSGISTDNSAGMVWSGTSTDATAGDNYTPLRIDLTYNPTINAPSAAPVTMVNIARAGGTSNFGYLYGLTSQVSNQGSGTVDNLYGFSSQAGLETGSAVKVYGNDSYLFNNGMGTATTAYGFSVSGIDNLGGGVITSSYAFWSENLEASGTNPYFLWYNGGGSNCNNSGVFRVNHFGILAYYNPCFTVYTPGLANFERITTRWGDTGVFGLDNRAYIGVEVGGTGVDRAINIIGANVSITSTLTPAVSNTSANSCGTTAASIVGNDNVGKITVGATGGTSCTVTFATPLSNAPSCLVSNETTANLARATSTTTTAIFAGTFVAGDVLAYLCIGR